MRVWKNFEEAYNKDYIQSTVKFSRGSVMFQDYFGWYRVDPLVVINENMDSDSYINILANNFILQVSYYPNSIFQQDEPHVIHQIIMFGG